MRRLTLLAAMLAVVLASSGPAVAQVEQESEQEGESGEVGQSLEVSSSGDSTNQCAEILAAAQSGNTQNVADVTEAGSEADDFEFEDGGSSIEVSPELAEACEQTINQATSAAGRGEEKKAAPAPAPGTTPTLAPKSEAKKEEAKKETAKKETTKKETAKKELPKTGGSGAASLLALGGGALLVTGGLLGRKVMR